METGGKENNVLEHNVVVWLDAAVQWGRLRTSYTQLFSVQNWSLQVITSQSSSSWWHKCNNALQETTLNKLRQLDCEKLQLLLQNEADTQQSSSYCTTK